MVEVNVVYMTLYKGKKCVEYYDIFDFSVVDLFFGSIESFFVVFFWAFFQGCGM